MEAILSTNPLYQGRCHCGAIRFEARADPANCGTDAVVAQRDFRLTHGLDALTIYRFGTRRMAHCFCRHCGVHPFAKGREAGPGGAFYVVRMRSAHEFFQL